MIYSGIESEFIINQKLPTEDVVRCSMLEIAIGCNDVFLTGEPMPVKHGAERKHIEAIDIIQKTAEALATYRIIGIHKPHIIPTGHIQTYISCDTQATISLGVGSHIRILAAVFLDDLLAVICGTVIDKDDLIFIQGDILVQAGIDTPSKITSGIVDRYNDRQFHLTLRNS
jgi:hypothetical protein